MNEPVYIVRGKPRPFQTKKQAQNFIRARWGPAATHDDSITIVKNIVGIARRQRTQ